MSKPQYTANKKEGGKGKGFDNSDRCFRCEGKGHKAYQCPTRNNLHIGVEKEDQKEKGLAGNVDGIETPQFNVDDLVDSDDDNTLSIVVRRVLAAPKAKEADWKRTTIFQTLVTCKNELLKLVIGSGSCMNVISSSVVERLKLCTTPHPQPYHVAWIDNTSIPISKRCLVPISYGCYKDSIHCDVVPMNVTHILLGRPWLFDYDVHHCGKENTFHFLWEGNKIILYRKSSEELKRMKKTRPKASETTADQKLINSNSAIDDSDQPSKREKKVLQWLTKKQFLQVSNESGMAIKPLHQKEDSTAKKLPNEERDKIKR